MDPSARILATLAAVALAASAPSTAAADSYLMLKGGASFPTADAVLDGSPIGDMQTQPAFTLAFGMDWQALGFQVGVGYMAVSSPGLSSTMWPITGALRLRIPIIIVAPYLIAGAGVNVGNYDITAGGVTTSTNQVAFEAFGGIGVEVYLGPVVLGLEGQYVWLNPTISSGGISGTVNLSPIVATANLGWRW
jgi:hypothetical protein